MLRWIFSPISGLITPVGGNSQLNPFVSRYIEDEAANTVAEAYANEFKVNTRMVFPNAACVRIGFQTGEGLLTVEQDSNISIGDQAGNNPTSSSTGGNVNVGTQARKSSNGFYNVAFGFTAGRFSTGNNNAMFGQGAASYLIGNHNVMFGSSAGYYSQGSYNVYLGYGVGARTTRRELEHYTLRIGANLDIVNNDGSDDLIVGDMLNGGVQIRGTVQADDPIVDEDLTTKAYVDSILGTGINNTVDELEIKIEANSTAINNIQLKMNML